MKNKGTIRKVLLVSMCVIFVLCLSLLFFIGLGDFLGWLLLTMVIVAAAAAIVVCIAMRDEKNVVENNDEVTSQPANIRECELEIERLKKEYDNLNKQIDDLLNKIKSGDEGEGINYQLQCEQLVVKRNAMMTVIKQREKFLFDLITLNEMRELSQMSAALVFPSSIDEKNKDSGIFLSYGKDKSDDASSNLAEYISKSHVFSDSEFDLLEALLNDELNGENAEETTLTETIKAEAPNVKDVGFSALSPKKAVKGEFFTIDIVAYEETFRHVVDRMVENYDSDVKETIASSQCISDNTMIRIVLTSPHLDIADCEETQEWKGRYLVYSFPVEIPSDFTGKQILFVAKVYFNDVIATKLNFTVKCDADDSQKIKIIRNDVSSAFMSYASEDRKTVVSIIQGMKKVRPDLEIFFDVDSIRSGENWKDRIMNEIKSNDVLYLCWSRYAKESIYVEEEWKYALSLKGEDSIEPIPLVSPSECPPPKELESKHFNDRMLYYAVK